MTDRSRPIRVLFVCTGNSCRSIFGEGLLRHLGGADFDVSSAGTHPNGLNTFALRTLDEAGIEHPWARAKSVAEYLATSFDHVITVCDEARQVCPVFPGRHVSHHWGLEDPADAVGTDEERMAVYRATFTLVQERVEAFIPTALDHRVRDSVPARDPLGAARP